MQIVGISEPGESSKKDELVVGIDFGTTNSLIAISKDYNAQIIKMQDGVEIVPSIIGLGADNIIVGQRAIECDNHIRSIKRLLAKDYSEIQSNSNLKILAPYLLDDNNIPKIMELKFLDLN